MDWIRECLIPSNPFHEGDQVDAWTTFRSLYVIQGQGNQRKQSHQVNRSSFSLSFFSARVDLSNHELNVGAAFLSAAFTTQWMNSGHLPQTMSNHFYHLVYFGNLDSRLTANLGILLVTDVNKVPTNIPYF